MPTTTDNTDNADTLPDGMYGTWQRKTWTTGTGNDYGFSAVSEGNVSEGQFARMEAGAWMRPMRAWLHLNNEASIKPQRLALLIDGDEPTGIVDIKCGHYNPMVSGRIRLHWSRLYNGRIGVYGIRR